MIMQKKLSTKRRVADAKLVRGHDACSWTRRLFVDTTLVCACSLTRRLFGLGMVRLRLGGGVTHCLFVVTIVVLAQRKTPSFDQWQ